MNILTIDKKIQQIVSDMPNKIAIEFGSRQITYKQLNEKSNKIANFLIDNYKEIKNVFVIMERSSELVEVVIGVMKSGGIFVPIEYSTPDNRIVSIINEINAEWVITTPSLLEKVNSIIEKTQSKINILLMQPDDLVGTGNNDAVKVFSIEDYTEIQGRTYEYCNNKHSYIYFTSGSTGVPKGVLGRSRSLMQFIEWEIQEMKLNEECRISQLTPISFDPFLRDILVPLCIGGTVCIPDNQETILNPIKLINWIEEKRITLIHTVPSLFKSMLNSIENTEKFKNLKYILLAGEMLRGNDIKKFIEVLGSSVQLVNLYGPTETTLAKVFYKIKEQDVDKAIIPVGKPIDFAEVFIFNEDMQMCATGIVGELYIRTPFITSGYCNDRELTKKVFLKNPFTDNPNDIIYKTGDLGRRLNDGNIELIGRADNQVKIRGMRIELGEIENRLIQNSLVIEAVVHAIEDEFNNKYLCAYVVTKEKVMISELRLYLSKYLPEHMIPSYYVQLDKMPLTSNGKIDRKLLPYPEKSISMGTEYECPGNELEKKLAAIWSEVLNLEEVGINDNFFAVGGNSLRAIRIAQEIYSELNMKIPVTEILNRPTIKELATNILNIGINENLEVMVKLNDKKEKNIFAFPPLMGYGICFKELSRLINNYTIYAFDFMENENILQEYIKLITSVQTTGPYILMGYSAGGKLVFEIAKELEKEGYKVSDIIIIDSTVKDVKTNMSDDDLKEMIEKMMVSIKEKILSIAPLLGEYIEEAVQKKIYRYSIYLDNLVNDGIINANIHQILSCNKNIDVETLSLKNKWKELTLKSFKTYQGFGAHVDMLSEEYIEKNAEIVNEILNKILK